MAVSLDPSPLPPAAPTTLLATLRAYTRLLETRRALQAELDSALSSFLSGLGTPLPSSGDALAAPSPSSPSSDAPPPEGAPRSTCASEAIRPPSQPELEQALQIGFGGLVELKEEARVLRGLLGDKWGREDLQGVVGRIEGWESERMRAVRRASLACWIALRGRPAGVAWPALLLHVVEATLTSASLADPRARPDAPPRDAPTRARLCVVRCREERTVRSGIPSCFSQLNSS